MSKLASARLHWICAELEFLKENYKKMSIYDCACKLGRSRGAVITMASQIGINRSPHYTEDEVETLRAAWMTDESTESIAKRLGRSVNSVYKQRARLGLPQRKRGNWRRKPIGKRWRL